MSLNMCVSCYTSLSDVDATKIGHKITSKQLHFFPFLGKKINDN